MATTKKSTKAKATTKKQSTGSLSMAVKHIRNLASKGGDGLRAAHIALDILLPEYPDGATINDKLALLRKTARTSKGAETIAARIEKFSAFMQDPPLTLTLPKEIREKQFLQRILTDAVTGITIESVSARIFSVNRAMTYSMGHHGNYAHDPAKFSEQDFNDEMVAVAVNELLDNDSTPAIIKDTIESSLIAIARSTGEWGWAYAADTEDIDKWLPHAVEAMRKDSSLAPKVAPAQSEPETRRESLQRVADRLCALLEDDNLPEPVRYWIGEAANNISNNYNRGDEFDIAWFRMFFADSVLDREAKDKKEGESEADE